jgi:hypothetical protein
VRPVLGLGLVVRAVGAHRVVVHGVVAHSVVVGASMPAVAYDGGPGTARPVYPGGG